MTGLQTRYGMLSLGICIGAAALHGGMLVSGTTVGSLADFTIALWW